MRRNLCATQNIRIFLRHVKQACFVRGKREVTNAIARHHDLKVVAL